MAINLRFQSFNLFVGEQSRVFSRILLASRPDVDGDSAALPALALALKSKARLRVLEWESSQTLSIRNVLTRWKLLPAGSESSGLSELGLAVKKRQASGSYCLNYLAQEARMKQCDLVVLSSLNSRSWLSRMESRWLGARSAFNCSCLLSPPGVPSIVDPETGQLRVQRILCCGSSSRDVASSLSQLLGLGEPSIEESRRQECWARARELSADLVVFGPREDLNQDFLEQMLSQATCPVLILPPR